MHSFCTLFDSNYLPRALVMYHSLKATGESFNLYAVCFDDLAYEILTKLDLPNFVAIPLKAFETKELLAVKAQRTAAEYCWTCTPHVTRYVMDTYQLKEVTYVDADLCFYEKPSLLFDEFNQANASVLITEHRYAPQYAKLIEKAGVYCVQFMTFKADKRGLAALQWWQDSCLDWCFARYEDGKFGDQKYLDDWPQRFEGVHVLQHLGGGLAPWNAMQYVISEHSNKLYVDEYPLVFYHFQGYRYYMDGIHDFVDGYPLNHDIVNLLYHPYGQALLKSYSEIYTVDTEFKRGWSVRQQSLRAKARYVKRLLQGVANEYRIFQR